jgi:hypothetical protein
MRTCMVRMGVFIIEQFFGIIIIVVMISID